MDRRSFFLGTLSVSGAVLLAGIGSLTRVPSADAATVSLGSWLVDDMWGHSPPYAHPIPHSGAQVAPHPWESLDPVDRMWGAGL